MGRVGCLETPVRNSHSSLRKILKKNTYLSVPDTSLVSVVSSDMALTPNVNFSNDLHKMCTDLVMRSRETLDSLTNTNGLSFVIFVLNKPKCC
jgi:hypothetical protein